jgi:hypothetical protein
VKTQHRNLVWLNLLGLVLVLSINYLSNSLPLNGKTPGQLSEQYPNLFVPAGFTFSIWGIIYSWLLVWMGVQLVALFRAPLAARVAPMIAKTGLWFVVTCVLNMAWLFAWHWEQVALSVLVMLGLLFSLLRLNGAIGTGAPGATPLEKWVGHLPFGIYQGWITVALIANAAAFLVSRGWRPADPQVELALAMCMVFAGALVAAWVFRWQNNLGHLLAVVWALWGIYAKRQAAGDPTSEWVARAALTGIVALILLLLLRALRGPTRLAGA